MYGSSPLFLYNNPQYRSGGALSRKRRVSPQAKPAASGITRESYENASDRALLFDFMINLWYIFNIEKYTLFL